jgi:uncharacterized C2H2 Zn-finger protein
MDSREVASCGRCGKYLRTMRDQSRHMSRPCDQDNVLTRRARAAGERESGVLMRPRRRGRKLMMKAET